MSLLKRGQVLRKRECGKVDNGKNRGATQRVSENTVKQGSNDNGVKKHPENKINFGQSRSIFKTDAERGTHLFKTKMIFPILRISH